MTGIDGNARIYDFAIVGAGVVGAMCARELARFTDNIVVLERGSDCAVGATKANSAIVHAGFDAKPGSLKAKLNVRGAEMMENTARELGVKYDRCGSIVAGTREQEDAIGELYRRGVANGVKELEVIGEKRLRELEPNICDSLTVALWAPSAAIICPYGLAIAALGNAMDNGVGFITGFCVESITESEGVYCLKSGSDSILARCVINAAGVHADEVAELAGVRDFTIHGRKGEYVLLDRTCGALVKHTLFTCPTKMGKGILVSPTVDSNLLVGPSAVDIDEKDNKETTAEGIAEVIGKSKAMVKDIPYRRVINSFTGIRAVGSTGDFIINMPKKGFINVAGIESPGLSASPAIAEYVRMMAQEEGLAGKEARAEFSSLRRTHAGFRDLPDDEKNALIATDPAWGRIVCRCEGISEGEILEAIRMNPGARDLDAVKRRTRSGMGPCQGGFCTPNIISLMEREFTIDASAITKKGSGSYLVLGRTDKRSK